MRVNIYAEETTDRITVEEETTGGTKFIGLRFWLAFPGPDGKPQWFEHRPGDDDSSAVTFWKRSRAELLDTFHKAVAALEAHECP